MRSTNAGLLRLLAIVYSLGGQALAQVNLGTATPYGVIASTAITNKGATVVDGLLGISPNGATSIIGFTPGLSGGINAANAAARLARQDARKAYNAAAAQTSTGSTGPDLGGQILNTGVYTASSSVGITGTLILDGQNNPDAVFIFQVRSTLTTATASSVILINGAKACNIFWQVESSATLGTATVFAGNILALTSITVNAGDYGADELCYRVSVVEQRCECHISYSVVLRCGNVWDALWDGGSHTCFHRTSDTDSFATISNIFFDYIFDAISNVLPNTVFNPYSNQNRIPPPN